jgi:hypothetical protein
MRDETYPIRTEMGEREPNSWSARVKSLAVNKGRFNPDTDIHSLESHGKEGTHYILGYKPHTRLAMEPECLALSTGKNPDGSKRQYRFIWEESEGPESKYATQLDEIDRIIKTFEPAEGING